MTSRCFWAAGMAAFRRRKTLPSGPIPIPLVGDFNGDGWPDLAVANYFSNDISVLLGSGDGTFRVARNFPVGNRPRSIVVGDFNGDGWLDLVVANQFSTPGSVSVLLGNRDGAFRARGQ